MVNFRAKFNQRKLIVLATLYYYTITLGLSGLTLQQLVLTSGASYDYLRCRLPVFANAHNKWRYRYVVRRAATRKNRAVFIYSLSTYGRDWLENKVPRDLLNSYVKLLRPQWEPIYE